MCILRSLLFVKEAQIYSFKIFKECFETCPPHLTEMERIICSAVISNTCIYNVRRRQQLAITREHSYFIRGSINVQLTGFDLAEQVSLLLIKHKQSSWIQTSQAGSQPYCDTSPVIADCLWAVWPAKSRQMSIELPKNDFRKKLKIWHLYKKCLRMWEIWAN